MTDLYLLATVRLREREREQRERAAGRPVSRSRVVLAQWLVAGADRLWPDAGREVWEGAR